MLVGMLIMFGPVAVAPPIHADLRQPIYHWCGMKLKCAECCHTEAIVDCHENDPECDCDDYDPLCVAYCEEACTEPATWECLIDTCWWRMVQDGPTCEADGGDN